MTGQRVLQTTCIFSLCSGRMVDSWDGFTFYFATRSPFFRHLPRGGRQIRKHSIGWVFRDVSRSSFIRHPFWEGNESKGVLCGVCPICPAILSVVPFSSIRFWVENESKGTAGCLFSHTFPCPLNIPGNGLKRCQFHTPKRWLVSRSITPHLLSGVFLDLVWSGSWP